MKSLNLLLLLFILGNYSCQLQQLPVYTFPPPDQRWGCYINTPFKWPADECTGSVCEYKDVYRDSFIRYDGQTQQELENIIFVGGFQDANNLWAFDVMGTPKEVYGIVKENPVSGTLVWNPEGLKGSSSREFLNAKVVMVERVVYYTPEECGIDSNSIVLP